MTQSLQGIGLAGDNIGSFHAERSRPKFDRHEFGLGQNCMCVIGDVKVRFPNKSCYKIFLFIFDDTEFRAKQAQGIKNKLEKGLQRYCEIKHRFSVGKCILIS